MSRNQYKRMKMRRALSENIALLAQFPKYLEDPTTNRPPQLAVNKSADPGRALTLEQEKVLAEVFALLLATTNDVSRVGAVCIEERRDGNGFIVRTVTNTGSQETRKATFRMLINAAKLESKSKIYKSLVLQEVVSTNQLRLLGRLRSWHAPRPNYKPYGPPIILQLQKALKWLKKNRKSAENLHSVEVVIVALERQFDGLEKRPTNEARSKPGAKIITKIILQIHSKLNISHLRSLLCLIPLKDSPWSGTPPDKIVRKFQKLSQYVSAAAHLRRAVCKCSLWEIEECSSLPYPKLPSELDVNDMAGILARSLETGTAKQHKTFQANLEAKLGKSRAKIETGIQEILQEAKPVHAEIQLLYHYVQHPTSHFQPRVLISNKECCYLCNLFIKSHGQFYTPKSHGAFYPKWRLPRSDEVQFSKKKHTWMNQVIKKFNEAIEKQIQFYLQNSLQGRPNPSESTFISMEVYTPTVTSTIKTKAEEQSQKGEIEIGQILHSKEPLSSSTPIPCFLQLDEQTGIVDPAKDNESLISREARSIKSLTSSSVFSDQQRSSIEGVSAVQSKVGNAPRSMSQTPSSLDVAPPRAYLLSLGCAIDIRIASGTSARFETPNLHFEFYRESPRSTDNSVPAIDGDIVLQVEWLSDLSRADRPKAVNLEASDLCRQELVCDDIFGVEGMIFHGKGHAISIQARDE